MPPTEAAALCEEVLKGAPDNVEALHLLGLVALQSGRPQEALERFQATVGIDARFAPAHNHAGVALCALGRLAEGIASYRRAWPCCATASIARQSRPWSVRWSWRRATSRP
jgi:Tfp pilus assembly protein PilF